MCRLTAGAVLLLPAVAPVAEPTLVDVILVVSFLPGTGALCACMQTATSRS